MRILQLLFDIITPYFRRKRWRRFLRTIQPDAADVILDVGGYPRFWLFFEPVGSRIDIVNIDRIDWDPDQAPEHNIHTFKGDGCDLPYADGSYDIIFSNSVIEHLGTWQNQQRFAAEAVRVGGSLWIQTPAREFFFEPHYMTPFIHWFPKKTRRRLLRNFTLWGLLIRPDDQSVEESLREHRQLRYEEMQELFPDCTIYKEKFLFLFTKSYIACRKA